LENQVVVPGGLGGKITGWGTGRYGGYYIR
jgi:hypothetical protein